MSNITREEALSILKKRIRPLDLHEMGEFEYEAQEFTNKEFGKVIEYINQQPQLSEDVEEGLLKDDLYELSNYDKVRTSRIIKHIKALENKLQEQVSEIEFWSNDRYDMKLTVSNIKQHIHILEQGVEETHQPQLNSDIERLKEENNTLYNAYEFRNMQKKELKEQLNAIRDVVYGGYQREEIEDKIKQILEEENNE